MKKNLCILLTATALISTSALLYAEHQQEHVLQETCPNCYAVAKDIQPLQHLSCPPGQSSIMMELTHSDNFYPMLLTLKNQASPVRYQTVLNQIKQNMTCTKDAKLLDKARAHVSLWFDGIALPSLYP